MNRNTRALKLSWSTSWKQNLRSSTSLHSTGVSWCSFYSWLHRNTRSLACLPVRQSTFKQAQFQGKKGSGTGLPLTTLQLSSITPVIKRTGKICCGERWGMPKSNKGSRWQRQMGRGEGIRLSLATTSHDAGLHIVLVLQRLFWMETI